MFIGIVIILAAIYYGEQTGYFEEAEKERQAEKAKKKAMKQQQRR